MRSLVARSARVAGGNEGGGSREAAQAAGGTIRRTRGQIDLVGRGHTVDYIRPGRNKRSVASVGGERESRCGTVGFAATLRCGDEKGGRSTGSERNGAEAGVSYVSLLKSGIRRNEIGRGREETDESACGGEPGAGRR